MGLLSELQSSFRGHKPRHGGPTHSKILWYLSLHFASTLTVFLNLTVRHAAMWACRNKQVPLPCSWHLETPEGAFLYAGG